MTLYVEVKERLARQTARSTRKLEDVGDRTRVTVTDGPYAERGRAEGG